MTQKKLKIWKNKTEWKNEEEKIMKGVEWRDDERKWDTK